MEIMHQTHNRPEFCIVAKFAQGVAISLHRVRDLHHQGKIPDLRIERSYRMRCNAEAEYLARGLPPTGRTGNIFKTSVFDDQTGNLFPSPSTH